MSFDLGHNFSSIFSARVAGILKSKAVRFCIERAPRFEVIIKMACLQSTA